MDHAGSSASIDPATSRLVIRLLGGFSATLDGQPLKGKFHRKAQALLAYLAVESNRPHSRESLAALLWPNLPIQDARTNLRQTLFYLRQALGQQAHDFLSVNRDSVQLIPGPHCWIDTQAMLDDGDCHERCATAAPEDVCATCLDSIQNRLALYLGDFLQDFVLPDTPEFEHWCEAQREELRCYALSREELLCNAYQRQGELGLALRHAQRCTTLDPWNEANQRRYMHLLAVTGQPGTAATWYSNYRDSLAAELDAEPEQATHALYAGIQQALPGAPAASPQVTTSQQADASIGRRQVTVLCYHIDLGLRSDPEDIEELAKARLASADLLRRHQAYLVQGHGGYMFGYLGYPCASEKVADQAASAALELQAGFASQFAFRAGIHTGTIITSGDPALPDLVGTVSQAALDLCQHAPGGCILVDRVSRSLLGQRFDFQALPARLHALIASPVDPSRLLGRAMLQPGQDATRQAVPLLGRQQALGRLLRAWERTRQGHRQLLLLRGEAGLGKSRLVRALRDQVGQAPACIRELDCLPEYQHTPLHPVIELIRSRCRMAEGDTRETRQAKLAAFLAQHHPSLEHDALPVLEILLASTTAPAPMHQLRLRKQQILETLSAMLTDLAAHQPLLLIIEDLQWLDSFSREVVAFLAMQDTPAPVLILLTTRTMPAELPWLERFTPIDLSPLKDADINRLIRAVRPTLSTDTVKRIVARADGIPLYAEELALTAPDCAGADAHTAQPTGFYGQGTASHNPTAPEPESIPASLHYLLLARMDVVPDARRILQQAATIGRHFDRQLLARVSGSDATVLDQALDHLADAGLISARPAPWDDYQFHHALIQEAAYGSQMAADREQTHQHVAQILLKHFPLRAAQHPGEVARHYTAAGNVIGAIPWWVRAGQQALQMSAYTEAARHLHTGLAQVRELQPNEARNELELSLLLPLGQVLLAQQGYGSDAVTQVYDRALALNRRDTTPLRHRFETLWGQWLLSTARSGASYLEAEALAGELLQMAQQSGEPELLIEAYAASTNTALWRNDLVRTDQHAQACLALDAVSPSPNQVPKGLNAHVTSLGHLSWAHARRGQQAAARQASSRSLALADTLGRPNTQCFALFFAAMLASFQDDRMAVEPLTRRLTTLANDHKLRLWQSGSDILQGWLLAFQGEAQGLQPIRSAARTLQHMLPGVGVCAHYMLARAHGLLQQADQRLLAIDQGLRAADAVHEGYFKAILLEMRQTENDVIAVFPVDVS